MSQTDNSLVYRYRQMADLKTTSLGYFYLGIMKVISGVEFEYEQFCYLVGQYLQTDDDLRNLTDDGFQEMKGERYCQLFDSQIPLNMRISSD